MESNALESLGILPARRSHGWMKVVVLLLVGAILVCGGAYLFRQVAGALGCADGEVVRSQDDGTLFLCEHLAVCNEKSIDGEMQEARGRMVATRRQYWFRLSIDERWYFKRFVPAVKEFLSGIAPGAETRTVVLDTQTLAYENDGADSLRQYGSSYYNEVAGSTYGWHSLEDGTPSDNMMRHRNHNERLLLLIDGVSQNGGETRGTVYVMTDAQMTKFRDWVGENVMRPRPRVSVSVKSAEKEIAAKAWDLRGLSCLSLNPIGAVYAARWRYYAVTPWLNAERGMRCVFLGVSLSDSEGLPDDVRFSWTL